MAEYMLGPLGGLRDLVTIPSTEVATERPTSTFQSLGGRRGVQKAPRAPRTWSLALGRWSTPAEVAWVQALATGAVPGPHYLYTQDAAQTNLLPADIAAPGALGGTGLLHADGATPGTSRVLVPIAGGMAPSVAARCDRPVHGAWSRIIPLPHGSYVLQCWADAAVSSALAWRAIDVAGAQVASGAIATAASGTGFVGATPVTISGSAVAVQVALGPASSGEHHIGGLRLAAGVLPDSGPIARTNLCLNPSYTTSRSGDGIAGTGGAIVDSRQATGGVDGGAFRRTAWTAGTTAGGGGLAGGGATLTTAAAVAPGVTYTLSAWVRTSRATSLVARATWVGPGTTSMGVTTAAPAGGWVRISVTAAAPAGSSGVNLAVLAAPGVASPSWQAGDSLDADQVLIEAAEEPRPYFDGSSSATSTRTYGWTGAPNASTSVERAIPADAVTPDWMPGRGVPEVSVSDPTETQQYAGRDGVRSDYTVTLMEVG